MQKATFRPDIQGLRAVAVLFVVLFHINKNVLPGGFVGVDIFFVISGFIMASLIQCQQRQGRFSFVGFSLARFRRIVPAYVMVVAVTSLFAAVLFVVPDFERFTQSLKSALYFASNRFFASQVDYFAPQAFELPLLHMWSLAVEVQFYLLFPLLFVLVPDRWRRHVLATVGLALLIYSSYRISRGEAQAEYFALHARIPEFMAGAFVAVLPGSEGRTGRRDDLAAVAGMAMVILSALLLTEETPFPGLAAAPLVAGTALLLWSRHSRINAWLGVGPMRQLGDLSYSLYLWHWPVLSLWRYYTGAYEISLPALGVLVPLMLILSILSYRFVETPMRRPGGSLKARWLPLAIAALSGLVAAQGLNPRLVATLPPAATRYADPKTICHGSIEGTCRYGAGRTGPDVVLIGDSHAAQLNLAAEQMSAALQAPVTVLSASSCVPIPAFDTERIAAWARPPCLGMIASVHEKLAGAKAVIVAGMWTYQGSSEAFRIALERFLEAKAASGRPVLVLSQVPKFQQNAQRFDRYRRLGIAGPAMTLDPDWSRSNEVIRALVGRHPNASFMDVSDLPLFASAPYWQGQLVYQDSHHLNETGAKTYGQMMTQRLSSWASAHLR